MIKIVNLFFYFLCLVPLGHATEAQLPQNHVFERFEFHYAQTDPDYGCSFRFSPVNFCDKRHLAKINKGISSLKPNYNTHFILLPIQEREKYHQKSLVAIDTTTGIVYPLPIDFYSGRFDKKGRIKSQGKLEFNKNSNELCIEGAIAVYRSIENGKFCFKLKNNKFVGYKTSYMYVDNK